MVRVGITNYWNSSSQKEIHPGPLLRDRIYLKTTADSGHPHTGSQSFWWDTPVKTEGGLWMPGNWHPQERAVICRSGYHFTDMANFHRWWNKESYAIEVDTRRRVFWGRTGMTDKGVAERARLLWRYDGVTSTNMNLAVLDYIEEILRRASPDRHSHRKSTISYPWLDVVHRMMRAWFADNQPILLDSITHRLKMKDAWVASVSQANDQFPIRRSMRGGLQLLIKQLCWYGTYMNQMREAFTAHLDNAHTLNRMFLIDPEWSAKKCLVEKMGIRFGILDIDGQFRMYPMVQEQPVVAPETK